MGLSFKSIFKEELHSNRFFKLPQWQRILADNRVVVLIMRRSSRVMRRSSRGPAELLSFSHKRHIDFVRTVISFQRLPTPQRTIIW